MAKNIEQYKFELSLADGKTRKFISGYDMWRWAINNNPKLECNYEDKTTPDLSTWFENRRQKSSKKL